VAALSRSRRAPKARAARADAPTAAAKPPANVGSALRDPSLWEQFTRIGGGLTPYDVQQIIQQADAGDPVRLVDLANEMRQKDAHLQATLFTREAALGGLEWEVVLPDTRGRPRYSANGSPIRAAVGEQQRRFVDETLRALDAPRAEADTTSFRGLLAHAAGGAYYGWAVAESLFHLDRRGRLVPRGFKCHSPRRFGFTSDDGHLVLRDSTTGFKPVDLRASFPHRFIISQPRITGDVPAREGLARGLMWPALFRNWTLSDWLKLAELAWKPWRIGKILKGASPAEKSALEQTLRDLTAVGAATHTENTEIHLQWPQGSSGSGTSGHGDLHARMAAEISKAVLGQTLTTEQGSSGSYSLGQVHNDIRKDIRAFDAAHVASVITRDVVRPLIELNFGPGAPVPIFRFVTEDIADFGAMANALKTLVVDIGMKIPASWAHDQLGIPKPEEGDELLGVPVDDEASEPDTNDVAPGDAAPPEPPAPDATTEEAA